MVRGALLERIARLIERSFVEPDAIFGEALAILLDASETQYGYWCLCSRRHPEVRRKHDPVNGIRIHMMYRSEPLPAEAMRIAEALLRDGSYAEDPLIQLHTERAETLWLDWYSSFGMEHTHPMLRALRDATGDRDELLGSVPIGGGSHLRVGLSRRVGSRVVSKAGRASALALLPLLEAPLRRAAAWHGVFAGGCPLSARENELYRLLLGPSSEKEIAATVGLTPRSTHQRVLAIFRKLGVSGRLELQRHWLELSRAHPSAPAPSATASPCALAPAAADSSR